MRALGPHVGACVGARLRGHDGRVSVILGLSSAILGLLSVILGFFPAILGFPSVILAKARTHDAPRSHPSAARVDSTMQVVVACA